MDGSPPHGREDDAELRRLIDSLSNEDVTWDGTAIGLVPELTTGAGRAVIEHGDAAVPVLMEALDDPSRFVVAHVLLAMITGTAHPSLPTWNGLAVDIAADGTTRIDPAQRPAIVEHWRRWQDTRDA